MISKIHFSQLVVGKWYNIFVFYGRWLITVQCIDVTKNYARMALKFGGTIVVIGEVEIYERPKPY